MSRFTADFFIVAAAIAACHPVVAQDMARLEDFAEFHILWDFVPPKQFFSLCMKVGEAVGDKSGNPRVCQSSCENNVAQFKDPDAKLHCRYMAMQMEIATLLEVYHGPYEFCKSMLMYQSYNLEIDVLDYVTKGDLWDACTESIGNAKDAGVGLEPAEAIQQNLPIGCKEAVEGLYKKHGMPIPSATIACDGFVEKAQAALAAQELSPADQGKQFCDGNSMQSVAFAKSAPSEAPFNFPLSMTDWKPKITLEQFQRMVRKAFRNPTDAFTKYDADGDANLDENEWLKLGRDLGIPTMDIHILSGLVDEDENGKTSKEEWHKIMGITLPELVDYSNKKYHNAENGWKAVDEDSDGGVTPREFEIVCAELGLTPENARKLFPQIDTDGNNIISQEEYKNVFGIGIPELKRRAREKYGGPKDSFKAVDANGDGKIQPEEFKKACKDFKIPEETAKKLLGKLDIDESGDIAPKEWDKAMGMTSEDAKDAIAEKFGANSLAMDVNGDGQLSPEEVTAGLEKSGASPAEAAKLLKDMDKDGDGKVSPEEIHEGIGGADLDKARGFSHPAAETERAAGITVPEFKERAKKKHGTPQAAFDAFDSSPKDGKISPQEFETGAQGLQPPIPAPVAAELFKALNKNGDGSVTPREWFEAVGGCADCKDNFGVTLPEFKERAKSMHGSPQAAYDAMDTNPKDGKITPEEFEAGCAQFKPPISADEAKPLFAKLDVKPADGTIIPSEFFKRIGGPSQFGLTVPEFKARAAEKSGDPTNAYKAMDQNGDGKVAPEEFEAYCQSLSPPVNTEQSEPLFNELDKNASGYIEPEEFFSEVGKDAFSPSADPGLTGDGTAAGDGAAAGGTEKDLIGDADGDGKVSPVERLRNLIGDADGDGKVSPAERLKRSRDLDLDGDGKVGPEEMGRAAASGKLSPEEMRALDTDGDGKLSEAELKQGAVAASPSADDKKKVMDTDGDGKISPKEVASAAAEGHLSPAEVRKMDTDGDGKLSPAELKRGAKAVETAAAKEQMKKALKKGKLSKEAARKMDFDGDGQVSSSEMKKGLQKQGWGAAEAEKIVKDLSKDGYWGRTWGDGYGDIDPFGTAHEQYNDLPHGLPPTKLQEAKVRAGSETVGRAMSKLLHDTTVYDPKKDVKGLKDLERKWGKVLDNRAASHLKKEITKAKKAPTNLTADAPAERAANTRTVPLMKHPETRAQATQEPKEARPQGTQEPKEPTRTQGTQEPKEPKETRRRGAQGAQGDKGHSAMMKHLLKDLEPEGHEEPKGHKDHLETVGEQWEKVLDDRAVSKLRKEIAEANKDVNKARLKWQAAKSLEGSEKVGGAMKKILHETAVRDLQKEIAEADRAMSEAPSKVSPKSHTLPLLKNQEAKAVEDLKSRKVKPSEVSPNSSSIVVEGEKYLDASHLADLKKDMSKATQAKKPPTKLDPHMTWRKAKALERSKTRGKGARKFLDDAAVRHLKKELSESNKAPSKFMPPKQ